MRRYKHELYSLWKSMRKRCLCKTHNDYKWYGAKGITISKDWDDFFVFLNDVGPRPSKLHTIDRINNNKGYCKSNVRWATKLEQTLNRRLRYECLRGHKWTKDNTIPVVSGTKSTRRCKICYEARLDRYRKMKEGL